MNGNVIIPRLRLGAASRGAAQAVALTALHRRGVTTRVDCILVEVVVKWRLLRKYGDVTGRMVDMGCSCCDNKSLNNDQYLKDRY